jgi:hypothetical protein
VRNQIDKKINFIEFKVLKITKKLENKNYIIM